MANQQQKTSIAILLNNQINDSLICMKKSLQSVSCLVDFVALSTLGKVEGPEPIRLCDSPSELQDYDLIIYQYGCCFLTISSWLNDYEGKIIIQYNIDHVALSNFRAYHHASLLVHQLELERQHLAEWVQNNCLRVYWLAGSPTAVTELKSWGVIDSIKNMAVAPPFLELPAGQYVSEKRRDKIDSSCILVTGPYIPDTGHIMIVNIIEAYQKSISQNIRLQFIGKAYAELSVYVEELKSHIKQSDLESNIYLEFSDRPVQLETFINADIMLCMINNQQSSPEKLNAQALGLPIVKFTHAEKLHTVVKLLDQALSNDTIRDKLIINGYRNISRNYTFSHIEHTFLTSVISALGQ